MEFKEESKYKNKFGLFGFFLGLGTFFLPLFGLLSIAMGFLTLKNISQYSTDSADRKSVYLAIAGMVIATFVFWFYSYVV